jgi:8-oxo-dGTP diphosphatase
MGPTATVAAVLERRNQGKTEVFLTKRAGMPYKGYWCLPGGHIEEYENARAAVAREVHEETGYDFDPAFEFYQDEIIRSREIHHLVLVFRGEARGTAVRGEDEVTEMRWFAIDDALAMDLAFRHREILERLHHDSQRLS